MISLPSINFNINYIFILATTEYLMRSNLKEEVLILRYGLRMQTLTSSVCWGWSGGSNVLCPWLQEPDLLTTILANQEAETGPPLAFFFSCFYVHSFLLGSQSLGCFHRYSGWIFARLLILSGRPSDVSSRISSLLKLVM